MDRQFENTGEANDEVSSLIYQLEELIDQVNISEGYGTSSSGLQDQSSHQQGMVYYGEPQAISDPQQLTEELQQDQTNIQPLGQQPLSYDTYKIQRVCGIRISGQCLEVLVQWVGYDELTWETHPLHDAPMAVTDFMVEVVVSFLAELQGTPGWNIINPFRYQ